jgi:cytochrome c5
VRNHDLVFLKHFSMVILFLMGVTVVLLAFVAYMHGTAPHTSDPRVEQRTLDRIKPAAGVYAGETGAAAQAAAAAAALAAAAGQVAYEGTLDGSVIYTNLCSACHGSGAGGAPMLTQAAWSARVAQGMDTLVAHATQGFQGQSGLMPAKGGNPSLTDEQVAATVKWMVDNLK